MKTKTRKLKLAIITMGLLSVSAGSGVILEKYADGNSSQTESALHGKSLDAEHVNSRKDLLPIGMLPISFGSIEASLSGN